MTTHLEKVARTGGPVARFPARKTQTRRIVPAAALAILVAVAALVMYVGTNSEVAPAIPSTQVQQLAPLTNWAAPDTNVAGIEYSPANPYVPTATAPTQSTLNGQEGPR